MEQILFDPMLGYSSFINTSGGNRFDLTKSFAKKFNWIKFILNIIVPFIMLTLLLFVFRKLYKNKHKNKNDGNEGTKIEKEKENLDQ